MQKAETDRDRQIVVMGVMGAGKTTIGRALAERLGCRFFDADDFHSAANVRKLSEGVPLGSDDRAPWIAELVGVIRGLHANGETGVVACSALTSETRAALASASPAVVFVHLRGDRDAISGRLERRSGHFANPALLDSQFAALETPADAVAVDVAGATPPVIVDQILAALDRH